MNIIYIAKKYKEGKVIHYNSKFAPFAVIQ